MLPPEPSEADLAAEPEGSDDAGPERALETLGFVLRAPRRRPGLAAGAFVIGVAATLAAAFLAPRVYTVDTKILVQRNVVIPLLGNPRRAVPADWDVPGRGTSEGIFRRDNLVAVIAETGLGARWEVGRSPALKLKDALSRSVSGPPSAEDTARMLVGTLEKRLSVQVDDTTIKISVNWHDAETAYRLVSCVEQRFLQDRGATETAAITDTIAILDDQAARQGAAVDAALAEVVKRQLPPPAAPAASPARAPRGPITSSAEQHEAANELAEKHRTVQAAEEAAQRRRAELRAQLADLRLTYASAHPLVLAMEEKIRQAEVVPPELSQMRQAEAAILERIKSFSRENSEVHPAVFDPLDVRERARRDDDPELAAARARLSAAVQKYEELKDRVDSARIELQTAQAAFKYRYAIVEPPELPLKPAKPNALVLLVVGLALSFALAFAAAAGADLASGRFIEPWQVRRRLRIPLLVELERP
jgi:uncharacterized protein involved in exopolysaccharide biosynthesis